MKYKDFQPTGFDPKGLALPDKQDWLVVPVSQNRDSGPLAQSNFEIALNMLGGESKTVEVCTFYHWGPVWFEIILVNPDSPQAKIVDNIESILDDYPLLNEEDYFQKEHDLKEGSWESWAKTEAIEVLKETLSLDPHDCDIEVNSNQLYAYCGEALDLDIDGSSCTFSNKIAMQCLKGLKPLELWLLVESIELSKESFDSLSHEQYHLIYQAAIKIINADSDGTTLEIPDFIQLQYNEKQIKLFS